MQQKMKRQSSKSTNFDPEDEDREARKQAELKERRIRLVDDLHKLKTLYYEEYMDGLTEKIKKQRRDIKRKTEELNNKLELERKKEQEVRHRLRGRKSRSSIHNDNSFLEGLEKTRLHRVCAVETKLLSEGKLKTIEERDRFWEGPITEGDKTPLMVQPGHGRVEVDSQGTAPSVSKESSNLYQEVHEIGEEPMAALLGLIREETETKLTASNRKHPGTIPLQKQRCTMSGGLHKKHPKVLAFEERFKQVEFPRLSAFTLDMEPRKEDAADLKLKQEYKHRVKLRQHASFQLNRMYEMSQTNQAATKRMLDRNEELSTALKGPSLSDVLSTFGIEEEHLKLNRGSEDESISVHESSSPVQIDMNNNFRESLEETNSEEDDLERSGCRLIERSSTGSDGDSSGDAEIVSISQLPLSLDAVMEKRPVIEAKRSGVFWYNYGKFLPSIAT